MKLIVDLSVYYNDRFLDGGGVNVKENAENKNIDYCNVLSVLCF